MYHLVLPRSIWPKSEGANSTSTLSCATTPAAAASTRAPDPSACASLPAPRRTLGREPVGDRPGTEQIDNRSRQLGGWLDLPLAAELQGDSHAVRQCDVRVEGDLAAMRSEE